MRMTHVNEVFNDMLNLLIAHRAFSVRSGSTKFSLKWAEGKGDGNIAILQVRESLWVTGSLCLEVWIRLTSLARASPSHFQQLSKANKWWRCPSLVICPHCHRLFLLHFYHINCHCQWPGLWKSVSITVGAMSSNWISLFLANPSSHRRPNFVYYWQHYPKSLP